MDVTRFSIDGASKDILINATKQEFPDHYQYLTEDILVLTTQKYFFRVNSNLLSVIILNFSDSFTTKIEIISGGGGAGLLQISLGSEGSANNKILNFFKKLCESNSWVIRTN